MNNYVTRPRRRAEKPTTPQPGIGTRTRAVAWLGARGRRDFSACIINYYQNVTVYNDNNNNNNNNNNTRCTCVNKTRAARHPTRIRPTRRGSTRHSGPRSGSSLERIMYVPYYCYRYYHAAFDALQRPCERAAD